MGGEGGERKEETLWAPAQCSLSSVGGREGPPATPPLDGKEQNATHRASVPTSFILLLLSGRLWGSPLPTPYAPMASGHHCHPIPSPAPTTSSFWPKGLSKNQGCPADMAIPLIQLLAMEAHHEVPKPDNSEIKGQGTVNGGNAGSERSTVWGAQKCGLSACWFLYCLAHPRSLWEILAWPPS